MWRALEHGTLYFCQRMPGELARFRWVIDAKNNRKITPHEDWWRVCVKPLLQSHSLREPIASLKGGDYSAFRRHFSMQVPDYMREHLPAAVRTANYLGAVFGREMEFADSRGQIGLQIADALTNCVRRALVGNLRAEGWGPLRQLMIRQGKGSVKFISMGSGGPVGERPYGLVARLLSRGERGMLVPGKNRRRRA